LGKLEETQGGASPQCGGHVSPKGVLLDAQYFTISVSFMIYESMYFITESEIIIRIMFIIYIIYKFEFSTGLLFPIYYLLFSMHNDEFNNLHGLNCYCWHFIINIYIFFIILEPGTPMLGTPTSPRPP
jgi:hypothetical protein